MSTTLDSFDRSQLGAFIQSPGLARNRDDEKPKYIFIVWGDHVRGIPRSSWRCEFGACATFPGAYCDTTGGSNVVLPWTQFYSSGDFYGEGAAYGNSNTLSFDINVFRETLDRAEEAGVDVGIGFIQSAAPNIFINTESSTDSHWKLGVWVAVAALEDNFAGSGYYPRRALVYAVDLGADAGGIVSPIVDPVVRAAWFAKSDRYDWLPRWQIETTVKLRSFGYTGSFFLGVIGTPAGGPFMLRDGAAADLANRARVTHASLGILDALVEVSVPPATPPPGAIVENIILPPLGVGKHGDLRSPYFSSEILRTQENHDGVESATFFDPGQFVGVRWYKIISDRIQLLIDEAP